MTRPLIAHQYDLSIRGGAVFVDWNPADMLIACGLHRTLVEEVGAQDAGDDFQKIARTVLELPQPAALKAAEKIDAAVNEVRLKPIPPPPSPSLLDTPMLPDLVIEFLSTLRCTLPICVKFASYEHRPVAPLSINRGEYLCIPGYSPAEVTVYFMLCHIWSLAVGKGKSLEAHRTTAYTDGCL